MSDRDVSSARPFGRGTPAAVPCLDLEPDDPLDLRLEGAVSPYGDGFLASVRATALVRISALEGDEPRLLTLHPEPGPAEGDEPSDLDSVDPRTFAPTGFSLRLRIRSSAAGELPVSARPGAKGVPATLDVELEGDVEPRLRPRALDITLHAREIDPAGDPGRTLAAWPLKICPPWWCHSHWHWTPPYTQTRWTECHGPCGTSEDCRCGKGRGGKICWGSWTTCWCK